MNDSESAARQSPDRNVNPRSDVMVNYIELPAPDIAEVKGFYSEAFGWTWVDYGPTYAAFEGQAVDVALAAEAEPGRQHAPGAENAIGPLLLLETSDLDGTLTRVTAAGGRIVSGPYAYPGGRRFHFVDPAGNTVGIYQSTAT